MKTEAEHIEDYAETITAKLTAMSSDELVSTLAAIERDKASGQLTGWRLASIDKALARLPTEKE